MKYIKDKDGQVKVMRKDGTHKYIAEHLAMNEQLLKDTGLEVVYEHEFITGDEPAETKELEPVSNDFTAETTQESKTKGKPKK